MGTPDRALQNWARRAGVLLAWPSPGRGADIAALSALDADIAGADLVFLGEMNHFIHEKSDFRLLLAAYLISRGWRQFAEELGWSDGRRIAAYLASGDAAILDGLSLFGATDDLRADRDDRPSGLLRASFDAYPHALMRAEQERFYRGLQALGRGQTLGYFGFDIDALPGGGYADLEALTAPSRGRSCVDDLAGALARRPGESAAQEAARLRALAPMIEAAAPALGAATAGEVAAAVDALADSLDYVDRTYAARTYEALRPGMAYREDCMKRRFADLRRLSGGAPSVVMSHALHLAQDDRLIEDAPGVGPGGGLTTSIGHHLAQTLGLKVVSVWMIYGGGEDSQPFPDLARKANYPAGTLNAQLGFLEHPTLLRIAGAPAGLMQRTWGVGHMYNAVVRTPLAGQVDAIVYLPRATPMRG